MSAYPLNAATAASIASDKTHTARLLARAGVRTPRGEHFFTTDRFSARRPPGRRADEAAAYAERLGFPVFVKPNDGSCGAYADAAFNGGDVRRLLDAMADAHPVALVQEMLSGREFRVLVVDGAPLFAYERRAGGLVGDGAATVAELLARGNRLLVADGMTPIAADSPYLANRLATDGLTLETILPAGAVLQASPRRNISAGAAVGDFTDDFTPAFKAYARTAAAALGLRVCGLDVMSLDDLRDPGAFSILVVKSKPSQSGHAQSGRRGQVIDGRERVADTWFKEAAT